MDYDYGYCIMRRDTVTGELWVEQADPTVLISCNLLGKIAHNDGPYDAEYAAGVLTIKAADRTITYKVDPEHRPDRMHVGTLVA